MDLRFNLFQNESTNEAAPAFKGNGSWNGEDFDIAVWKKKDKNGKGFYSFKFSDPYKKSEQGGNVNTPPAKQEEEPDLPF